MPSSESDLRIDYIEFPAVDMQTMKRFYREVFGWHFQDWGAEYSSFTDGRMRGGFYAVTEAKPSGTLVVLYASDLVATEQKLISAGGRIVRETFDFPGGRRFHFQDPSGNELAVWTDEPA